MKKSPFFVLIAGFYSVLFSVSAFAGNTPNISNLTQAEADSIAKNFGNAIVFRSIEPPSSNGKIWGFGIGIGADLTSAGGVNSVLRAHGGQDISILPAADIIGTLQGPFGISGEVGFLPKISVNGFSFKRTAFNAKWTFTDVLLREHTPFDAALRVGFGKNQFSYGQTINGVSDTISFDSKALRAELAMSRKFLVFEPFIGLGILKTSSTLANTASVSLYNFQQSDSYDYSKSSFLFNVGTEVRLIFITIGAQVEWAFGETTTSLKAGLKF
jgi:hypothetical protein